MLKMSYTSYDTKEENNNLTDETVKEIKNVYVAYDGGRMSIYVNGKLLYRTNLAGNDFEIAVGLSE